MWIELLCFHLAEIGMIWTRDCSPTKSDTTLGRHSMQGQVGSSSSETTVWVVVPPNQSAHCDIFESIFAYFLKSFLIVRTMPRPTPMGIRHEVFALAREGIKQGAIAARVGLTRATVNRILKRHAATGSLVPGKSSGAPRKTTPPARPCIAEDGPTGSLLECSGLDGVDEKSVRNDGWLHNGYQPTLVPWLPGI